MKKLGIAGIAALMVMLLACFAPLAMATDWYGIDFDVGGPVWRVDISEPVADIYGNEMTLDTADIDTIVFSWYNSITNEGGTLVPVMEIETPKLLILRFAKEDLAGIEATESAIDIALLNGDMVYYAGPGFAYRWG